MTVDEAFAEISRMIDLGTPAHGYLVVGLARGDAGTLTDKILHHVFGDRDLRAHPDVHRLSPVGKARLIRIGQMLEYRQSETDHKAGIRGPGFLDKLALTAFQGGWKVGIVYGADRFNQESANTFLKTLEEPPPKTLFLLLTDQPEQLLPTIISRCQRIDLPDARGRVLEEPYHTTVLDVLASGRLRSVTAAAAAATKLAAVLDALKAKSESEVDDEIEANADGPGEEIGGEAYEALVISRFKNYRRDFAATLLGWFRDLMAMTAAPPSHSAYDDGGAGVPLVNESRRSVIESRAAKLTLANAIDNVQAVEDFVVSVDQRNINDASALGLLMDRLRFGVEAGK